MPLLYPSLDPEVLDLRSAMFERPRPFGSRFAPQSRTYLMDMPLLLIITGLIAWLVPSNATFVLGAAVGAFAGLYVLVDIFLRSAPVRVSSLLGMTILLSYNLGALNSWLTIPRAGLTIAEYFTRSPADLARAAGLCMISAALLFAVGELYERPIFGEDFRIRFDSRSELLVFISTGLVLVGYATGKLGFMGVIVDEYGRESPLAALAMWWSPAAFAYSVCATLNGKRLMRVVLGACTLVQLIALVPTGRRYFAYAVLLAILTSRLGRFRTNLSLFRKILLVAIAAVLISVASIAFLYLRVAGWGHREASSIGTRVRLAYDTLHTRSPGEIVDMLQENASTRTFILGYFSDLLEASQHSSPLYGEDAAHYFKVIIPSAILANKFEDSRYQEEQLVNMQWGFGYVDEANTILTAGVADFGILGALVYPLLLVLVFRVILEWTQSFMPTIAAVMITLAFLYEVLLPEQSLAGYFGQVRNGIIFAVILYGLAALPKFQLRNPNRSPYPG